MTIPKLRVEAGFGSAPDDPQQDWTDISGFVRLVDGVSITRGRSDEQSQPEPGETVLVLDNDDGRFTWGNSGSPYYPNVIPGVRVRVSVVLDRGDLGTQYIPRSDGVAYGWPLTWATLADRARVRLVVVDRLAKLGETRTLRDPLLEELGTAAGALTADYLSGDQPEFPGDGLYPAEDLYPASNLWPS